MKNQPLHLRLRKARKEQGYNQAALGRVIGKSASAICQLEKGGRRVLAGDLVKELCQFLKIEYEPKEDAQGGLLTEERDVLAFCKSERCPVANFDFEDGELMIQPKMYRIWDTSDPSHCTFCGEHLETGCSRCLTPITQGAVFCSGCERPLVRISPATLERDDLKDYAQRRATRRHQLLSAASDVTVLARSVHKNSRLAP